MPDKPFITNQAYFVCQFTAPVMVSATLGGRTVVFEPGFGRRATVSLRHGRFACVLGGWIEP